MGKALKAMARRASTKEATDALYGLLNKMDTDKPKASDLAEIRSLLNEPPDLWKAIGQMGEIAVEGVLRTQVKKNPGLVESVLYGMSEVRRDLRYDEAPALERLLIEQVAVLWGYLSVAQLEYATRWGASPKVASYWEKRIASIERRYQRAMKSLARVRKLAGRGPLQVNIAEQQLVVAG